MHVFVDISSHGFGHLAITAPIIAALASRRPGIRLTLRSALPADKLRQRIRHPFVHIREASDFGYVMVDALHVDRAASAAAYRAAHADWPTRIEREANFLHGLAPDLVLSNVSYLPLAGAAVIGRPAVALCSLNWADLFDHHFGDTDWGRAIHDQMLTAYRSALCFLRPTPGMPMPDLDRVVDIGPVAAIGRKLRLSDDPALRHVVVSMGGVALRLPVETWPRLPGIRWLVPAEWRCSHPDAVPQESFDLPFADLLSSADALLTKPGYGAFSEAACNGVPVLFQRRHDWPEEACLIDWLSRHGRSQEVSAADVRCGNLANALATVWQQPAPRTPTARGAEDAGDYLACLLA